MYYENNDSKSPGNELTCTIKVRYICSTYMGIGIKLRWDSLWGKNGDN